MLQAVNMIAMPSTAVTARPQPPTPPPRPPVPLSPQDRTPSWFFPLVPGGGFPARPSSGKSPIWPNILLQRGWKGGEKMRIVEAAGGRTTGVDEPIPEMLPPPLSKTHCHSGLVGDAKGKIGFWEGFFETARERSRKTALEEEYFRGAS
jgi:hypothetical protein